MNKWALQIATAILGIVPIATGLIGMSGISDPIYASIGLPANPLLDSNLRFFGGVWFGLGLALYWLIPKIEKQTVLFRAIWGMIFVGGIGRLISMLLIGLPPVPSLGSRSLRSLAPRFSLHGKHA
jgi:predicted membrane channel-forming protein YqfA (hemolysin III family)